MKSMPILFLVITLFYSCENVKGTMSSVQVPAAVQQSFTTAYPDTEVEWEEEANGTFEAEFNMNGEETSSTYSAEGELLETEVEIRQKNLPAAVLAAITGQFPGHEIEEAARITYSDGRIAYEAELEGKNGRKSDAIFAADGTFLERYELSEADEKD